MRLTKGERREQRKRAIRKTYPERDNPSLTGHRR